MSGSSCKNKNILPESGKDKTIDKNISLFQQVAVLRKEMDEQIKEMKELSKATMLTIDRVRKLKVEEIGDHIDRIDARLKTLEGRMAAIDRINDSASMKKDECLAESGSASIKLPQPRPALVVPSMPEKPESHVIETTMAEEDANKEKDHIAETIKHYEKEKDAPQAAGNGNIFTKLMGSILPAQKKAPASAEPKSFGKMADASKENGETAVHNPPEIKPAHEEEILKDKSAAIVDPPEKMDAALEESPEPAVHKPPEIKPAHEEEILKDKSAAVKEPIENKVLPPPMTEKIVAAPPKEQVTDLLAVDKKDLEAKMEEMISSASQMAAEKRYSEATEVYLKLADAYEKNKDDSLILGLGPKIDELYDKISSNLLTNLMETDTGKKTPIFDKNRNF